MALKAAMKEEHTSGHFLNIAGPEGALEPSFFLKYRKNAD